MNLRLVPLSGMVALSILLSACGSSAGKSADAVASHAPHQQHAANGDLQETTSSLAKLPTFLDKQRPEIKQAYQIAASTLDVLKWIPCYCGCGESAGHTSNQNCFVKEVKPDGSVVWDDHGTRCGVCLEIAVTAARMKQDGRTVKEIRTFIDQKYEKGYAKPTATQMPA
ncbi:PCYCGC domain-containing protein [Paenibacillus doosanensis]|uniref:PCYCGC domain-containing protein n=1 Tax=Paenibacillus doosanensis TaxID=1229154 RepID=UPI0021802F5F|nr:PCYCGC domain-containing protein [Paenibacillus doosanensis]MCS7459048.1 PCYCGC domain-containing protein [Paenibacillus doosanensis]